MTGAQFFNASVDVPDVTVAVLAGGLGTRLRPVLADRPKGLAEVHKRPFLAYLLDQVAAAGLRYVVLCTGYLGEKIYDTFGVSYGPLKLAYSHEREPLGTGGALRLALPKLQSNPVLIMNGDSYCAADLRSFLFWHCNRGAKATVLLTRVAQTGRYGSVNVDGDGAVLEFMEKRQGVVADWINAGIYLLSQPVLSSIPQQMEVSLEYDIFHQWIGRGLYGYQSQGPFLDIGTPEDFGRAEVFFRLMKEKKRNFVVLDRDGTIIEECSYLSNPEQIKLIPGAAEALRELSHMGFGLVVITNQSGVGRGFFDDARLRQIHERLRQLLEAERVQLDGLYFCPHKPQDGCSCRKPGVSLIERASRELVFDPETSIVIGDKSSDIEMGRRVGATTFLVRTGYGAQVAAEQLTAADYIVDDLPAAAEIIRRSFRKERDS
jgi:histidinol-phosphate phosphatase family protein